MDVGQRPIGGVIAIVDRLLFTLTFVTALGSGLIAGLFFAFSVAVMQALARLPSGGGMAAVMITALARWHSPGSVYLLVGGALYLVGSLLVTVVFNVPKNEALASVAPADPDGAGLWADYLASWTLWNHVRAVASLASLSSLILGLCYVEQ